MGCGDCGNWACLYQDGGFNSVRVISITSLTITGENRSRLQGLKARVADDPATITKLGVDETSTKKGHHYVTLGVDLDVARVIHVTEGKGKATLQSIQQHLESKGVDKEQVEQISMDLSPSFIAGAAESFPAAHITFDRFHVVKLLNEAMNQVRIIERKEHDALKGHKYTFLKNRENLSDKKEKALDEMITLYPTLGEAYRLKVLFNDLWEECLYQFYEGGHDEAGCGFYHHRKYRHSSS